MQHLFGLRCLIAIGGAATAQTHTYHGLHSVGANGHVGVASHALDYRSGHITITSWEDGSQGADIFLTRGDTCNGYGGKVQYYTSPGIHDEYGFGVAMDAAGDMWVVGYTDGLGAGATDGYLLKADTAANLPMVFGRAYGGASDDYLYSLDLTTDGGAILVGSTDSYGAGSEAYAIKTDANGDQQWARAIGSAVGFEDFWDVQQTADGGYIMVGSRTVSPDPGRLLLVKFDPLGTVNFVAQVGPAGTMTNGTAVVQTADGGYIVAGQQEGAGPALTNGYIVKFNALGSVIWDRVLGGPGNDGFYDVVQTDDDGDGQVDDGYFVTGSSESFGGAFYEGFYAKFDAVGGLTWIRRTEGFGVDEITVGTQLSTPQGYLMAGTYDLAGDPNLFVLKTRPDGLADFFCNLPTPVPTVIPLNLTSSLIALTNVNALGQTAAPFTQYGDLQAVAVCCCDGFGGAPGCTPVPLAMQGFDWVTVERVTGGVKVEWKPLMEGFDRYEVWSGPTPDALALDGSVGGHLHAYIEPHRLLSGPRFYRVVGIDQNGGHVYSELRVLAGNNDLCHLSPNIVSAGQATVLHVPKPAAGAQQIAIVNANGQVLRRISLASPSQESLSMEISTAGLPAGIYWVQVAGVALLFAVQ